MNAALEVEVLKLRRSTAAAVAGAAVVGGVSGLCAAFTAVARSDSAGQMATKVRPMLMGTGWEAYLGLVAQVLSVGVLLAAGVVVAWSFGREHTDGTFGSLFAIPTGRRQVALAKAAVLVGWGMTTCVAAVAAAVLLGGVLRLGPVDDAMATGVARALAVGSLTTVLTLPLGYVASALRGYLPGIAALLGIVVLTQVATVAGAGAWFPYAAPGIWAGMGGQAAAAAVTPLQLLLTLPVGALGLIATVCWWDTAEAS